MESTRLQGYVDHCCDGDGGTVRITGPTHLRASQLTRPPFPFRLWAIDAPERGQACWTQARTFLEYRVLNKSVTFLPRSIDTYGRHVVQMWDQHEQDLGLALLTDGLAWFVPRFAPKLPDYALAALSAHAQRIGIFESAHPIPPWVFRRRFPTMHDRAMSPLRRRQKS
jgi:endonuclease YncB( thermonuclease family)